MSLCFSDYELNMGRQYMHRCQRGGGGSLPKPIGKTDNWPQSTCQRRVSSHCGYVKYDSLRQYGNIQREIPGVYFDLTATKVGGRPIHHEHDNHLKVPRTMLKDTTHQHHRYFDCQQPFWGPSCY